MLQSPWGSNADAETSACLVPCTTEPWSSSVDAETSTASFPCPASPGAISLQKKHISHKSLIPAPTSQHQFLKNPTLNSLAFKKKKKNHSPVKSFLIASSVFALTCFNCSVTLKNDNSILYRIDIGMGLSNSPYDDESPTNPFIT